MRVCVSFRGAMAPHTSHCGAAFALQAHALSSYDSGAVAPFVLPLVGLVLSSVHDPDADLAAVAAFAAASLGRNVRLAAGAPMAALIDAMVECAVSAPMRARRAHQLTFDLIRFDLIRCNSI